MQHAETSQATLVPVMAPDTSTGLASPGANPTLVIPVLGLTVSTRSESGVQVVGVASGGVAESAYMHVGDVINAFDGKPVKNAFELAALCGTTARGAQVRVGYL
jgi:S1-C subfamily serine protease